MEDLKTARMSASNLSQVKGSIVIVRNGSDEVIGTGVRLLRFSRNDRAMLEYHLETLVCGSGKKYKRCCGR